jgi:hypothetical protein
VRIFFDTVFFEYPFLSGIAESSVTSAPQYDKDNHQQDDCHDGNHDERLIVWPHQHGALQISGGRGGGGGITSSRSLAVDKNVGKAGASQYAGKPDHDRNQAYQPDDNLAELQYVGLDGNVEPVAHHPQDHIGDEQDDRDVKQQI